MNGEWSVPNVNIKMFGRVFACCCCVVGDLVREGGGE